MLAADYQKEMIEIRTRSICGRLWGVIGKQSRSSLAVSQTANFFRVSLTRLP